MVRNSNPSSSSEPSARYVCIISAASFLVSWAFSRLAVFLPSRDPRARCSAARSPRPPRASAAASRPARRPPAVPQLLRRPLSRLGQTRDLRQLLFQGRQTQPSGSPPCLVVVLVSRPWLPSPARSSRRRPGFRPSEGPWTPLHDLTHRPESGAVAASRPSPTFAKPGGHRRVRCPREQRDQACRQLNSLDEFSWSSPELARF